MPKLLRINQKIFAGSASAADLGISQFGSLANGTPNFTIDPAIVQALGQWTNGWNAAVMGGNSPALEDLNAVHFVLARQLAYLFQSGMPEWDADTVYYSNSMVSAGGQIYRSLQNSNTNNAVSDSTYWILVSANLLNFWGGVDAGGSPNVFLVNATGFPADTFIPVGTSMTFKVGAHTNNGASTLTVNGNTPESILDSNGNPIPANTLISGHIVSVFWNGSAFILPNLNPVSSLPPNYISGCPLSWVSGTTLSVGNGSLIDSTNIIGINVDAPISLDISTVGAGGLDTGTVASDTWYYTFVIADSTGVNGPDGLISLSPTSPTLPTGYDVFRRVGSARTDSISSLKGFVQVGIDRSREAHYFDVSMAGMQALSAGTSTTFADIDLSGLIPVTSKNAFVFLITQCAANDTLITSTLRPKGTSQTSTPYEQDALASGSTQGSSKNNFSIPTDSNQFIEYKVTSTGGCSVYVEGWKEDL